MISSLPSAVVRVRVPAKINLSLAVGDLRDDGYHELVTVFQAVGLYDEIAVRPADELTVITTGTTVGVPVDGDNLAGKAAIELATRFGRRPAVRIEIAKQIPVAGGMAGGSADAAGALLACAHLWQLHVTRDELLDIAAELGSDVPFALVGGTAVGTGRGEQLVPALTRHPLHWVLAIADGGLSTPAVFSELDRLRGDAETPRVGPVDEVLAALADPDPGVLAAKLGNDLQPAAISLQPGLRRVLYAGQSAGALHCLISGSGPTVAMLCRSADHAADLASELAGMDVCRSVRVVSGPVPGARLIGPDGTLHA